MFSQVNMKQRFSQIKVVGVGKGGINVLNKIAKVDLEGVEYIAIDTSSQTLQHSPATETIQIEESLTNGCSKETMEEIKHKLSTSWGMNMVFIIARMGEKEGTEAAPLVGAMAKKLGVISVGMVTKPFEGQTLMRKAMDGIERLKREVDTLIVIPSDRLIQMNEQAISMPSANLLADDILCQGVKGISELVIGSNRVVNVNFANLASIMKDSGSALMGIGSGSGDNRALQAAKKAFSSPLLSDSKEAKKVLINITCDFSVSLSEIERAASFVVNKFSADANIVFGAGFDDKLVNEVWVTIIATGEL